MREGNGTGSEKNSVDEGRVKEGETSQSVFSRQRHFDRAEPTL